MEQRLEVRPTGPRDGCLQDIHWALGSFGYFPSYVLGAVTAAQLWETLRGHDPQLEEQIGRGEFAGLFGWLREHVHSLGAKITVKELMKQATGQPLSAHALLRYLEAKYLESPA
jgi:carboxypeptidase Taq